MPKTNLFLTTVNLIKSFIGLGILASPFGFSKCGYIIASLIIITNGTLNMFTIYLQCQSKNKYGRKVKTYADLGYACYGQTGRILVAIVIMSV